MSMFVLCALPLFTLIYFINTDQMCITGIAIILFVFIVALGHSSKAQRKGVMERTQAIAEIERIR